MALSPAEKQRRYRERKKEADKHAPDATGTMLKQPFHEFMTDAGWSEVSFPLGLAGIAFEPFADDRSGKDVASAFDEFGAANGNYDHLEGSIGRAELMMTGLLEAAHELARHINAYKRKEITARIHQIETSDLSAPDKRKQALADIVRLKNMLDQLDKQVRPTLPQWKVTGD